MSAKMVLSKMEIFPDDTFLVSYPRSGNTWVSMLLNHYVSGVISQSSSVAEFYKNDPDSLGKMTRPRVIKIHSPFESLLPKVIYLVRDARDVAVSYYYYHLKFLTNDSEKQNFTFERYLHLFNTGKLDDFGTWNYHVNSWIENKTGADSILIVKYEDLKAKPEIFLSKIVQFIWGSVNPERVGDAVRATEFSRLQAMEVREKLFEQSDTSVAFFRKGIIGDWENHFDLDMLKTFVISHGLGLKRLGYLSSEEQASLLNSSKSVDLEPLEQQLYHFQSVAHRENENVENLQLHHQRQQEIVKKFEKTKRRLKALRLRHQRLRRKLSHEQELAEQRGRELDCIKGSKLWVIRSLLTRIRRLFSQSNEES